MRIFISYAFADKDIMNLMKKSLERRKLKVYTAEYDEQFGKLLFEKIQSAIERSNVLLVIITKDSLSASVNQEVGYAMKKKMPIIPFVEEGAKKVH